MHVQYGTLVYENICLTTSNLYKWEHWKIFIPEKIILRVWHCVVFQHYSQEGEFYVKHILIKSNVVIINFMISFLQKETCNMILEIWTFYLYHMQERIVLRILLFHGV